MKKNFLTASAIVLIIILFFITGCAKPDKENNVVEVKEEMVIPQVNEKKNNVVEIKEKMFISQVNDVYLNPEDYYGKTIKLEGLFIKEYSSTRTEPYCFVVRYGPGCCGSDGNAGFEVAWANNRKVPYPEKNAWVEAAGELKTYEEDDYPYLYLDLSSLNVLSKRGAEYVSQ